MSNRSPAPGTVIQLDASESARLRNAYAGAMLRRGRLWKRPHFQRKVVHGLLVAATLINLLWIIGLEHVMQPMSAPGVNRGPIQVTIITPPEVFEIPPEPVPEPVEFKSRVSRVQIKPPEIRSTPPPLTAESGSQTQARIGSAGEPTLNLFNPDGSLRMPKTTTRIGPPKIENPQEAAKAQWAEIQRRGENPLDCQKTRFANVYQRDESLGDKVSRKYLSWVGLADRAGIAERAADKQRRANEGCDPAK